LRLLLLFLLSLLLPSLYRLPLLLEQTPLL
jgi:hypothetical protein